MMGELTIKQIVEALIMASEEPLTPEKLHRILVSNNKEIEIKELKDIINELSNDYNSSSIELNEVASGWRFQIRPELSPWIAKLYEERPPRYSRAMLEILALIAYRQPTTRAEIESVRGVAVSSNIIKTLLEHEWIRIVGHKEVPGRPALFATTKKFLDHFNLKHLDELPPLMEFTETIDEEMGDEQSEYNAGTDQEAAESLTTPITLEPEEATSEDETLDGDSIEKTILEEDEEGYEIADVDLYKEE